LDRISLANTERLENLVSDAVEIHSIALEEIRSKFMRKDRRIRAAAWTPALCTGDDREHRTQERSTPCPDPRSDLPGVYPIWELKKPTSGKPGIGAQFVSFNFPNTASCGAESRPLVGWGEVSTKSSDAVCRTPALSDRA
jgi:hypothetical protein